jgi:hypothetical protein
MKVTQYYRSEVMMYCCSQEEGSIMAGVQLWKIEREAGRERRGQWGKLP